MLHTPIALKAIEPLSPPRKMWSRSWHNMNAVTFLDPEVLANEPELVATKWPAYYGLCPQLANVRFAEEFSIAFRAFYRANIDRHQAETVRGIDIFKIRNPQRRTGQAAKGGHLTSLHLARQVADALGLPYQFFIEFCMKFAGRRGVQKISRPNQLVPSAPHIKDVWDIKLAAHIAEWQAAGFPGFDPSEIPIDRSKPAGCFGVPGARDDRSSICQACPFAVKCRATCGVIEQYLAARETATGEPQTYVGRRAVIKQNRNDKAAAHMRDIRGAKRNLQRCVA